MEVKGSSQMIKQGTFVKGIRLINNEDEIEGKVNGSNRVIRNEFVKKS